MGILKGEKRGKIVELFEAMIKNFLILIWDIKAEVQEAQKTSIKINAKKKKTPITKGIIFRAQEKKEILKEVREKKCYAYRGTKTRITSKFLEAMLGSKEWDKISKVLGEKQIT